MILADTSVWVDHFRKGDPDLARHLLVNEIAIHPYVVAELALGNLANRVRTLSDMERLPWVRVARTEEVRRLIEMHKLFGRGIGFVDAHLLASMLLSEHTTLWTHDRRLRDVAMHMGAKLFTN
jgi:hypothetical protein